MITQKINATFELHNPALDGFYTEGIYWKCRVENEDGEVLYGQSITPVLAFINAVKTVNKAVVPSVTWTDESIDAYAKEFA